MVRASIVGLLIVLLAIIVACGEEATPTKEPDATPGYHSRRRCSRTRTES